MRRQSCCCNLSSPLLLGYCRSSEHFAYYVMQYPDRTGWNKDKSSSLHSLSNVLHRVWSMLEPVRNSGCCCISPPPLHLPWEHTQKVKTQNKSMLYKEKTQHGLDTGMLNSSKFQNTIMMVHKTTKHSFCLGSKKWAAALPSSRVGGTTLPPRGPATRAGATKSTSLGNQRLTKASCNRREHAEIKARQLDHFFWAESLKRK